jgi:hypothetical protein
MKEWALALDAPRLKPKLEKGMGPPLVCIPAEQNFTY